MAGLGMLLLIVGGLAHLLPMIGLQLKIVKAMEAAHPQAVQYCLIAGGVLLALGLVFGRATKLPEVGEVVADKEEEKEGGSAVGGVLTLLVLAALGVGVYLQAKYGTFDPLLKTAHEEIQKLMKSNSPAKSA